MRRILVGSIGLMLACGGGGDSGSSASAGGEPGGDRCGPWIWVHCREHQLQRNGSGQSNHQHG